MFMRLRVCLSMCAINLLFCCLKSFLVFSYNFICYVESKKIEVSTILEQSLFILSVILSVCATVCAIVYVLQSIPEL